MRSPTLIIIRGLALSAFLCGLPEQATHASEAPGLNDVLLAAHFEEPLVRTSATSVEDDTDLARAIERYSIGHATEPLAAFLQAHQDSGWSAAIELNIGLAALHEGRFTDALEAWKGSWSAGKDATAPDAKLLVDRAAGELAKLEAALGQNDDLEKLLREISSRPVAGPATEAVQVAAEELELSKTDPRHLFLCGPLALQALLEAVGATAHEVDFLSYYVASSEGTNFAELQQLASRAKVATHVVLRQPGEALPVPSIVHWKVGHFAAIVGREGGKVHLKDPVFPNRDLWMTEEAIDSEASGYFLVLDQNRDADQWQQVAEAKAAMIWGKGPTSGTTPGAGPSTDAPANKPCGNPGLCGYNILESTVSLELSDSPVGYRPPIGPAVEAQIGYNQREDSQPATFSYFNLGPKWTLGWLSYVTDDPAHLGTNVSRYLPGGGAYYYSGFDAGSGLFAAQTNDGSRLVLASQSPITYRHQLGDGSVEIFALSDGATAYPRHVFLSQIIDPQGNALTFTYDGLLRLTSLTDATGRQTTLTYGHPVQPLLVTGITDPFGRSAKFTYDPTGRLKSITDTIGLTSTFSYDANSLVNAMTTPYGTTNFSYTAPGTSSPPRFVQVTDPLGYSEREEWLEPAPISASDPAASVPQGMPGAPTNAFLQYRDSFHWDKHAYVVAGCTPTGGCDYTKARDRHFAHDAANPGKKSMTIESEKYALEGRTWYNYPGQVNTSQSGTGTQPTAAGRVLDDGSTQLRLFSYDTSGFFKPTQIVDPLGRTTSLTYSDNIDLASVSQTTAFGVQQTVAQFIYNTKHRPIFYTDASGETTQYAYNASGQVLSATNAKSEVTSFHYNGTGDLLDVTNANGQTQVTYTYDAFDRVLTRTDSEGRMVTYGYDAADRIVSVTYPDGTSDDFTYDKLDLVSYRDRVGRTWSYGYDADRRLVSSKDPAGQSLTLGYNENSELTSLTDPNSNLTSWAYDVQGRLVQKTYADSSTVVSTYETTTSRLKSVLDALGQTKQYAYLRDDSLGSIAYLAAVNPTANVSFAYDPYFPRLVSMTDGTGTTQYSYNDVGSSGALLVAGESGPLLGGTISYTYDELGRPVTRTIGGTGAETYAYDAIGRVIEHSSDLGDFTLDYLGQTDQPTLRQLASSTLSTSWSYLPNSGDRRLSGIGNVGLSAGQFSTYGYTTTPENMITGITETSDAPASYPASGAQTASFNNLNQLTTLNVQSLTYDANGNLLSDGQRNFSWDAENRLVGIIYPGQPGKATGFTYDGLSRRVSIASTPPGGGSATTTSYLWCGSTICQARNAGNVVTREFLDEGEFVPGSPGQPFFYGLDQIGSVRRAFVTTSTAPAYDYDSYGNSLTATAPTTDFGYAGMFTDPDSGLYLTKYRAYDPGVGRWLSRDPLDSLAGDFLLTNLYNYVGNDPIAQVDPLGLQEIPPQAMLHIISAHGAETMRTRPGNSVFLPDYSTPQALQDLANQVFADPSVPPVPFPGGLCQIAGSVVEVNLETGETRPYFIGTDANGNLTNIVLIRYRPETGQVVTMFPYFMR